MIVFGTANKIAARPASKSISMDVLQYDIATGGTAVAASTADVLYNELSSASVKQAWQLVLNGAALEDDLSVLVDETKLSFDKTTMIATSIAGGEANIKASVTGKGKLNYPVTASITGTVAVEHTGYAASSLGEHITAQMTGLINGASYSHAIAEYIDIAASTFDINNPNIVTNENSFVAAALDFSGTSVLLEGKTDDRYPLSLVSPKHALVAAHVAPSDGAKVVFKLPNGTYATRTVVGVTALSDIMTAPNHTVPDLKVVLLDADVTGASIYKTFSPTDIDTYLPSTNGIKISNITRRFYLPVLRKALHFADGTWGSAHQINTLQSRSAGVLYNARNLNEVPAEQPWYGWGYPSAIGGDSGSPEFCVINGEPVLLSVQHTTVGAEDVSYFTASINTIMNDLSGVAQGTYALTHPDLILFNTY